MKSQTKITNKLLLYWMAFLVALFLRLSLLDILPFNESEADFAIRAHQLANGTSTAIGENAAYVIGTSFLFTLFDSTETIARLLPAILGSFAIWIPFLFRKAIPQSAGVIAAFFLAIDPGLVTQSRIAGGAGVTIGLFVLFAYFLTIKRPKIAGVLFALSLFSGSAGYFGIFTFLGIWGLSKIFQSKEITFTTDSLGKPFLISVGITILLFGTYFLQIPAGLSSLFSGLANLFLGTSPNPFESVYIGLLLSQPLLWVVSIVLVMISINKRDKQSMIFSFWLISAIVWYFIFPNNDISLTPWLIIPAWMVTSIFVSKFIDKANIIVWGKTGVVLLFLIFFWDNFLRFGKLPLATSIRLSDISNFFIWEASSQNYLAHIIILALIPIFILFTTYLFSTTWQPKYAIQGLVWGVSIWFGLFTLSNTIQASFYPSSTANQLWYQGDAGGNWDLVVETLQRLSEYDNGTRQYIEIQNQSKSASAFWALRKFPNAEFGDSLDVANLPSVVITNINSEDPFLHSVYRGTIFASQFIPAWHGLPPSIVKWITQKEAPIISEKLVLWVRADAFPAGSLLSSTLDDVPQENETELDEEFLNQIQP